MSNPGGRRTRWHRFVAATSVACASMLVVVLVPGRGTTSRQGSDRPGVAATGVAKGHVVPNGQVASPQLPFELPSVASLRSSTKLVFAHYWTPLPISIDNAPPATDYYTRNFLRPDGEAGRHAAYGGLLRDRPLPRAPRPGPDWRLQDMRTEVRQAIAAGLDGFTLDVIQFQGGSNPQLWRNAALMMQAAREVDPGFKIMIMPDMGGGLVHLDVAALARGVATLARSSSAFRLSDGRLVVSPFKAEAHDVTWWSSFLREMKSTYGIRVAFLPTFVGDERRYVRPFAVISYGMSVWGSRNPAANDPENSRRLSGRGRAARIRSRGLVWMQPVSVQDERPDQGVFDEADNTANLRDSWQLALKTDAQFVQLTTWNDYTEGSAIAPSSRHGWSYLDISSYYLTWFKTGSAPKIVRDAVYLTHRTQGALATPRYPQTQLMSLRPGGSRESDFVEALTFAARPARVMLHAGRRQGRCDVAAGVGICTVRLDLGRVGASMARGSLVVARVASPWVVVAEPYVQDLQYVATSSLRSPLAAGSPPPGQR